MFQPWLAECLGVSKAASRFGLFLTLVMAAGLLGFVIWRARKAPVAQPVRVGFQDADAPLTMPQNGEVDERFCFLSAWQRAQIPLAARFDPPLGSDHGGFTYNAQAFWEMNDARGGRHLGDDLNGIGGMNTDLGDPVFATADALVVYSGEPSPAWGNVVVLAHRTRKGKVLQSMFAHLDQIEVAHGALVGRGSRIGTVGTAHGNYPAHLHFEMRDGDEVDIGGGYAQGQLNRLDPSATVESLRQMPPDCRQAAALTRMLLPNDNPWSGLETKDAKAAERLMEIIGKEKK